MAVPHTLADYELLHAVLELGHAVELLGRVVQSIFSFGELGTQCCPSACMVRVPWSQERKDRPRESSSRFNVAMRDVSIQSWYL